MHGGATSSMAGRLPDVCVWGGGADTLTGGQVLDNWAVVTREASE